MLQIRKILVAALFFAVASTLAPAEAKADGPLRRWWRNLTGQNTCACQNRFVPAATPVTAGYNPYNLQPGQCMKTCQQTCTRTVVNYVPQTAYRTVYNRVPVTRYRPVTNSDPCTGCTVTCMRPCTTYTYQVQRVPYTTYRPVYRQEAYRVPVTTITSDCANGSCGVPNAGCPTCATGSVQNFSPTLAPTQQAPAATSSTYYEPANTLNTGGTISTPTPADSTPSLNSIPNPQTSQRPSYPGMNVNSRVRSYRTSNPVPVQQQMNQPQVVQYGRTASASPVRKQFGYSPIRTAGRQTSVSFASTQNYGSRWVED